MTFIQGLARYLLVAVEKEQLDYYPFMAGQLKLYRKVVPQATEPRHSLSHPVNLHPKGNNGSRQGSIMEGPGQKLTQGQKSATYLPTTRLPL